MRIFICLMIMAVCFSSCQLFNRHLIHKPPTHTFLIPSTIEGPLMIIYAENCGIQPKLENNKATFTFQSNGSVIIKDEYDMTAINEFYIIDSLGNKTRVEQIASIDKKVSGEPAVIADGLRYTTSHVFYVNNELKNKEGGATCKWYLLYTKETSQTFDEPTRKRLDSMTNQIVKECRAKFYAVK